MFIAYTKKVYIVVKCLWIFANIKYIWFDAYINSRFGATTFHLPKHTATHGDMFHTSMNYYKWWWPNVCMDGWTDPNNLGCDLIGSEWDYYVT